MTNWTESVVRGYNIKDMVFSPNSSLLAAGGGRCAMVFHATSGRRLAVMDHEQTVVGVHWVDDNQLYSIVSSGEIVSWEVSASGEAHKNTTTRVTPATIKYVKRAVSPSSPSQLFLVLEESGTQDELVRVGAELQLEKITLLPRNRRNDMVAVTPSFVAWSMYQSVKIRFLGDNSAEQWKKDTFTLPKSVSGWSAAAAYKAVQAGGVTACGDSLAFASSLGRVYVWNDVSKRGLAQPSISVHWHQIAPALALTSIGGLFSGGQECVLGKFGVSAAECARPSFLPRMAAPIHRLHPSADSSLLAVLLADNSLHIVVPATMAVSATCDGVVGRKNVETTVFACDPAHPEFVIGNGKAGQLQWVDVAVDATTKHEADISLERTGGVSLSGGEILQPSYNEVTAAGISVEYAASLEHRINYEENVCRLRMWRRGEGVGRLELDDSFELAASVRHVAICPRPANHDAKIVITADSENEGRIVVWEKAQDATRWRRAHAKQVTFQDLPVRTVSCVTSGGLFASVHRAANSDLVVLWDTLAMKTVEVLSVSGEVRSVQWYKGEQLIVAATDKVLCLCTRSLSVLWEVEQALEVAVGDDGAVAWEAGHNDVIRFDPVTGAVLGSWRLSSPVQHAAAFCRRADGNTVLAIKTDEGMSVLAAHVSKPAAPAVKMHRTPFAQLLSGKVDAATSADAAVTAEELHPSQRAAGAGSALRLLDAPAHALPPLAHLAPLFISNCLRPNPPAVK